MCSDHFILQSQIFATVDSLQLLTYLLTISASDWLHGKTRVRRGVKLLITQCDFWLHSFGFIKNWAYLRKRYWNHHVRKTCDFITMKPASFHLTKWREGGAMRNYSWTYRSFILPVTESSRETIHSYFSCVSSQVG